MEKMNFIRTPHKAFFTIYTIILIAQGFVKHAGNKIQAFQGHEQAQNDDAWRKTLKSLQSKKKHLKFYNQLFHDFSLIFIKIYKKESIKVVIKEDFKIR